MDDQNELMFESELKAKLNWGQALIRAVDRCDLSANAPLSLDDRARDTFFNSVMALDALLSQYKDDDYTKELKQIANMSEPRNRIMSIDEYFLWYGLCCRLISKSGLLPAEDKELRDAYDDEIESCFFTPKKKN